VGLDADPRSWGWEIVTDHTSGFSGALPGSDDSGSTTTTPPTTQGKWKLDADGDHLQQSAARTTERVAEALAQRRYPRSDCS
jgi:hypothetical protein